MKWKGSKSPRPRFHILFPIERITSADEYKALLKRLQKHLPVFDERALDAGRFYFGNKEAEVRFHEGETSIIEFLDKHDLCDSEPSFKLSDNTAEDSNNKATQPKLGIIIPEGRRNSTLSQIAAKLIKRYGDTGKARSEFMLNCDRCSTPLDSKEIESIWKSAQKFYSQKVLSDASYIPPEEYEKQQRHTKASPTVDDGLCKKGFSKGGNDSGDTPPTHWDKPIPFDEPNLPTFPVHTLPDTVRGFVTALAESTQTPVDMCACSVLATLALCIQGKYKIQGKPDWIEPLNLYVVSIAEPSERKSAVISAVSAPVTAYEAEENERRAPEIEKSKMDLRILELKQKQFENQAANNKDKVDSDKITRIAGEIANFKVKQPLKLYVDDITTEKLISELAKNGSTAIISSEGGIFDMLKGMYSKNVNIDVFLKAYSGDTIRLDRVNRPSESIKDPALTILLTVQPSVISGVMNNHTFRGRGLTARFLYCMPRSLVGKRRFSTAPIPYEAKQRYREIIEDMLSEENDEPELITLSPEALRQLEDFSVSLEPKLRGEYADISDWAGKLVGNVLRFAGILTRANRIRCAEFAFDDPQPLVVSADIMQNAITLGSYFIHHAKAVYDFMGADETTADAKYILNAVTKRGLESFTRRDFMRFSKRFSKAADMQTPLTMLVDRGFLWEQSERSNNNKQKNTYFVNPLLFSEDE